MANAYSSEPYIPENGVHRNTSGSIVGYLEICIEPAVAEKYIRPFLARLRAFSVLHKG